MEHYIGFLRGISERCGLLSVKQLADVHSVKAVYRVTVYHPDRRTSDVMVTLKRGATQNILEAVYVGQFDNKPLTRTWTDAQFEAFIQAVRPSAFDKLVDQRDMPLVGADLCLFERGGGSFIKAVLFAIPAQDPIYMRLLTIIQTFMPEALRQI
ncbi:MAG: hypothetical protein SH821_00375 [Phototrophicales bacterium]|nr:hypothetical protein [Phototrophicales bacterium]